MLGEPLDREFGGKSGNRPKEDWSGKARTTSGNGIHIGRLNVKYTCLFVKLNLLHCWALCLFSSVPRPWHRGISGRFLDLRRCPPPRLDHSHDRSGFPELRESAAAAPALNLGVK